VYRPLSAAASQRLRMRGTPRPARIAIRRYRRVNPR
jgi:hypothetical protein